MYLYTNYQQPEVNSLTKVEGLLFFFPLFYRQKLDRLLQEIRQLRTGRDSFHHQFLISRSWKERQDRQDKLALLVF